MKQPHCQSFEQAFASQLKNMAVTLRPGTIDNYKISVNSFLRYLHAAYPKIHKPSLPRRDPHILGWLQSLHERSLKSGTRVGYLFRLRRLFDALALNTNEPIEQGLIVSDDFPPLDKYLPKPLSPENDHLLDNELRKNADLMCYGLLLLRATGMRIGECLNLATDCLHPLGQGQWALKVPLGKLHNERWLPVDEDTRKIIDQILPSRSLASATERVGRTDLLFPKPKGRKAAGNAMRSVLNTAAMRAGCSAHITPHQLRHTYATEMLRAGVSLPALKELLGHKDIRMTMRYIQVSQNDLQQQYRQARQNIVSRYAVPGLPHTNQATLKTAIGIASIRSALDSAIQLLEIYIRHLNHNQVRHDLQCLARRLNKIWKILTTLDSAPK